MEDMYLIKCLNFYLHLFNEICFIFSYAANLVWMLLKLIITVVICHLMLLNALLVFGLRVSGPEIISVYFLMIFQEVH